MELKAKMLPPLVKYGEDRCIVQFEVNNVYDALSQYEELKDKNLRVTAKAFRQRRSLDANAYYWVLQGEIAKLQHTTALELHDRDVFTYRIPYRDENGEVEVKGLPESKDGSVDQINLVDRNYFIEIGSGIAECNGKKCKMRYWMRIKGTRDFDTKEMAELIDDVVSSANELGIQTATPKEIELMKVNWKR